MTQSTDTMDAHKDELDRSEQAITARAKRIEDALQTSISDVDISITRFNEAVESGLGDTEALKGQIENKINDLHDAVREISTEADHIDDIGLSAASKITQAMAMATTGPNSLATAVQKAVTMIGQIGEDSGEKVTHILEQSKRQAEAINKAGEQNALKLSGVVKDMDACLLYTSPSPRD